MLRPRTLLSSRQFVGFTLTIGFMSGARSIAFCRRRRTSFCGAAISGRIVMRVGIARVMQGSLVVAIVSGVTMAALALTARDDLPIPI